jgi:uncharacterized protein (TIGR01244 family)
MRIALFAAAVLFAPAAFAQTAGTLPQKLDLPGFQAVVSDAGSVYVSGQPSEAALRDLAAKGVKTVISVRTVAEMNNRAQVPFDEAALAKELGMTFVNVPMGGASSPYTPEALDQVISAIKASDGEVLLHCTVGWRASHVWAAYLVKEKGLSYEEAIRQAEAINLNGYKQPGGGPLPVDSLLGRTPAP